MTFKQLLIFTALFVLAVAVGLASAKLTVNEAPKAGSIDVPIYAVTRSAQVSVGASSTGVASSSPARRMMLLQNTSSSVTVFCSMGNTAAVDSRGFFINASSTFTLPLSGPTMYSGAINCIASSSVLLLVTEA